MTLIAKWIANRGVSLHALENVPPEPSRQTPLLIVPGVFGNAEDYVDEMSRLSPRRCLAVSLRGRGSSDVPATGYALGDHVTDVAAAVLQSGFERPAIMGYAMGAAYAIAYAISAPESISALIIGDYPARYRSLSEKWVATALETMGQRARPEVAHALQRASAQVSLWERLVSIRCPIAVLRGGQAGSMVTEEIIAKYREFSPRAEILTIEPNGHELWKPDFNAYILTIENFLTRVDQASSAL